MVWLAPTGTWLRRMATRIERDPAGPVEPLVEAALRDGEGLVLLGAFGSGKTELSRRIGAKLAVPVIPLRVVARAPDPDALLRTLLAGADTAIFDGLDEIGRPHADGAQLLFERCRRQVRRWVLTSRPGHVRTELSDADPLQLDAFAYPILEIDPYVMPPGSPAWLAAHPVLWSLWREGHRGERPIDLVEAFLAPTGRIAALEALAWRAFSDPEASAESASFPAADVAGLPGHLFVEDLDGRWRFGHRSLYDALVARHLSPRLAASQGHGPDALTGLPLSGAMRTFLAGPFAGWRVEGDHVVVPRGNFIRGGSRSADERPLVVAHLAREVRLARRPVSNREFAAFLDARGPLAPGVGVLRHWRLGRCPEALLDHAVTWLRPEDAEAFAAFHGARLPTADEWEKAVRGWDGREWPWGDTFDPSRATTADRAGGASTAIDDNPQGALFDAIGGSFEYTASAYRGRADRGRIVMGGSCAHPPMRASLRLSHTLSGVLRVGLRLVYD